MFNFGANWRNFLARADVAGVSARSERDVSEFTGVTSLQGQTFLDIGCGTGLGSLAAVRLGAARVVSVDVSRESVECAEALRAREGIDAARWTVLHGSVLEESFVATLPVATFVQSWGVLHHTGDMRRAFANTCTRIAPGGLFHTAIYNRVWTSPMWHSLKRAYNGRGPLGRFVMHGSFFAYNAAARAAGLKHPFRRERGMSVYYDAIDWLGGYPYEYATHDEVVALMRDGGDFSLVRSRRDSGFGCNEFLFRRAS